MITFDGSQSQTWGGTTFIIHAAVGGSMVPADYGIAGGWGGTRTTSALVDKFSSTDKFAFWSSPKPPKRNQLTYPVLYCPGNYQTPTWDPTNVKTVIASVHSNNLYEGYLNMIDNSEFKFCTAPNWNYNFGESGTVPGTLVVNGNNIKVANAGYYKINVDTTAKTFTVLKTTWAVIGSATPGAWATDTPMTYDATNDVWTVVVDLVPGDIKFRANAGWDLNYGDDGVDGILDAGGANIAIPSAGTYSITMKLGAPDYTYTVVMAAFDHRPMFYTTGQSKEIKDIAVFTDGYAVTKFTNLKSDGTPGSNLTYTDTDFPLFRLGDVYLMYAEAVLRGGAGGDRATALSYINLLRVRAYGDATGNINDTQLDLNFILDERARELYWEGYRRTDLVRFGQFSNGTYLWPWKGGSKDGQSVPAYYNIFPIPSSDVTANPNLHQNTGY
ncbi:MAG: RagB/SusD family nutrient uptake outer membrane protein [Bacteroidota bacterium]